MDFVHVCLFVSLEFIDTMYKGISVFRVVVYPWQEKRIFPTYLTQKEDIPARNVL